jgi:hypothetical protein
MSEVGFMKVINYSHLIVRDSYGSFKVTTEWAYCIYHSGLDLFVGFKKIVKEEVISWA